MSDITVTEFSLSPVHWSASVLPPLPVPDGSPALAAVPVPVRLAILELVQARVRALVQENRQLQLRNHLLLVALDDVLDRACAHALCCCNEQLLTTAAGPRGEHPAISHCSLATGTGPAVY